MIAGLPKVPENAFVQFDAGAFFLGSSANEPTSRGVSPQYREVPHDNHRIFTINCRQSISFYLHMDHFDPRYYVFGAQTVPSVHGVI